MNIRFFFKTLPKDPKSLHIWVGKTSLPHDQLIVQLTGQNLPVAKSQNGKPYFPDSSLHFNLSDSEDRLAIAFSWRHPVGIDMEVIRPIEGMDQLIQDCFSAREQAYVKEKETLIRFWQIWNRKEACFKALGLGLQDHMDDWDCFGNGWISVKGIRVRSLPIQENLSIAVAFHE